MTINILKKSFVFLRTWIKLLIMFGIGALIIGFLIFFVYRPMYSVSFRGEFMGYSKDRRELQTKIDNYLKSGDGGLIAFVELEGKPEYKMTLLKKGREATDDEIFNKIIEAGVPYYRFYAILDDGEEKGYVQTYQEAEEVVAKLKEKESANINQISYVLKYETNLQNIIDVDSTVAALYVEKPKITNTKVNYSKDVSYSAPKLEVALATPVSGMITSRFGTRSRGMHTGLDIATSSGTPVKVCADGVVVSAKYSGAYGNMIVVAHTNSLQTYYCHLSRMYVSEGTAVTQGDVIGAVGSTGNSTGPHLHLEIRLNGTALNPQNYLYK